MTVRDGDGDKSVDGNARDDKYVAAVKYLSLVQYVNLESQIQVIEGLTKKTHHSTPRQALRINFDTDSTPRAIGPFYQGLHRRDLTLLAAPSLHH